VKYVPLILILAFCPYSLFATPLVDYVKNEFDKIQTEIQKNLHPEWRILNPLLDVIPGYIKTADKNTWNNPSPERLKRIAEVAEALEPYVPLLIHMAKSTKDHQGNQMAYTLLRFAKPSPILVNEMNKILENPYNSMDVNYPLLVLFEKEIENSEIKDKVIEVLAKKYEDKNSFIYCDALDVSAELRMPETVPIYKKFLEREIQEAAGKSWTVQIISQAVQNMGPPAEELRPLLEQYLEIVNQTPQDHPGLKNSIIGAIETLDGKRQPREWLKINGAGIRQATPDPLWYDKIVAKLKQDNQLPEILKEQNTTQPLKNDNSLSETNAIAPKIIDSKLSKANPNLIHGLTKRNLLSALMIAGGGALLVMTLLYAFWPRQK